MNRTFTPTAAALPLLFALSAFGAEPALQTSCPATENNSQHSTGITRLKIEFSPAAGDNVVRYYALDAQTLRQAQLWQAEQKTPPSAGQFSDWLSYNGGKLDRADGPAGDATYQDGTHIEQWYRDGKLDRAEGPAVTETYPNGRRVEQWYRDGKQHRADGPAVTETYPDGRRIEQWYRDGKLDRADGPAVTETYPDGSRIEQWYRDGKQHRAEGPAVTEIRQDGSPRYEAWYRDGKPHRADGPAVTEIRQDGSRYEAWWRKGTFVKKENTADLTKILGVTVLPPQP